MADSDTHLLFPLKYTRIRSFTFLATDVKDINLIFHQTLILLTEHKQIPAFRFVVFNHTVFINS